MAHATPDPLGEGQGIWRSLGAGNPQDPPQKLMMLLVTPLLATIPLADEPLPGVTMPLADKLGELKAALQGELDNAVKVHPDFAMSLGWHSTLGSFGLAAGMVPSAGMTPARPVRPLDKFLFGSGTKPLTATAVLRLAEAGALSLEDAVAKHVDSILHAANGTTMAGLFGPDATRITVRQLLHMQSGLPDFDVPSLDDEILRAGDKSWPPYAVLHSAASQTNLTLHFAPGSRTEYSSTNYVVAGLVLLAHQPSAGGDWTKLDLSSLVFPSNLRPAYADVNFINDEPISSMLTVPGVSGMIANQTTQIWAQRGGVLGWTCGNMAASAKDVASFYHDLLVAKTLLSEDSLAVMQKFHVLDFGWAKGHIIYGAVRAATPCRHSVPIACGRRVKR